MPALPRLQLQQRHGIRLAQLDQLRFRCCDHLINKQRDSSDEQCRRGANHDGRRLSLRAQPDDVTARVFAPQALLGLVAQLQRDARDERQGEHEMRSRGQAVVARVAERLSGEREHEEEERDEQPEEQPRELVVPRIDVNEEDERGQGQLAHLRAGAGPCRSGKCARAVTVRLLPPRAAWRQGNAR